MTVLHEQQSNDSSWSQQQEHQKLLHSSEVLTMIEEFFCLWAESSRSLNRAVTCIILLHSAISGSYTPLVMPAGYQQTELVCSIHQALTWVTWSLSCVFDLWVYAHKEGSNTIKSAQLCWPGRPEKTLPFTHHVCKNLSFRQKIQCSDHLAKAAIILNSTACTVSQCPLNSFLSFLTKIHKIQTCERQRNFSGVIFHCT